MTAAAGAVALERSAVNPWLVAVTVVIPTFMEVLDTTIANVALRYIAGGLSAPVSDSEWVITSYLAANAIILPISGWISTRLGRRNYFMLSIAVFTFASALCGLAPNLPLLIAARILQGLAGGGLQPSSQAILLDAFPQERQGAAMTVFSIAALLAPVVGPTLGGYLTDNHGWEWIFYVNVPVGLLALWMCGRVVRDPDYLVADRLRERARNRAFDSRGLMLLSITMICWEILLSKGQEWDWWGDPHGRIQALFVVFAVGLVWLIRHELRVENPLIALRALRERNFRCCCLFIFLAFGILYANTVTLPSLLQSLFGYDATTSGLVLSPAGLFAVAMLVAVGTLLSRGTDARYLMGVGAIVLAVGNFWLGHLNLDIGPWQVVAPRVVVILGLSMCFAPLNVAAFLYIPKHLRPGAVGLLALLRNEGGSVGTSVAHILQSRREQLHTVRLNEHLDPFDERVGDLLQRGRSFFFEHLGDPARSDLLALQTLQHLRDRHALALAFFDVFVVLSFAALALVAIVFFMKRSVAEKGAHVGAE